MVTIITHFSKFKIVRHKSAKSMVWLLQKKTLKVTTFKKLKGSVSRVLRWVLLYINQKLSLRPFIASHKIFDSLKG